MADLRPVYVAGDGDVKGPASSSNNFLPLFADTTGKLLKSSGTGVTTQGLAILDDNTPAEQRNTIGLDQVNNTSDLNKPVSILQATAILEGKSLVVGYPIVTGPSSSTTGQSIVLSASTNNLLAGGSIVDFTWTLPDGSQVVTPGSSNSASLSIAVSGAVGDQLTVSVIATDNLGNNSKGTVKIVTVTSHVAPTTPTKLNVAATIYQNSTGNQLTVSGSTASDGATITYSLSQSGAAAVTFSKTTGIAANEAITFTAPSVAADTPITISAVAVDSMGGVSSATSVAVTIAAVPRQAGIAYGGGFYVGRMKPGDGNTYALIVAPKASGESADVQLKTSEASTPGTTSTWDGAANTAAMIAAGAAAHPAANFCKGLSIGGYTDWALPAKDQLELLYRQIKPDATANDTSSGANPSSDPVGANYTSGSPVQTSVLAFRIGGSEAFPNNKHYWASTETSVSTNWRQMFSSGSQTASGSKLGHANVRAVRMVKI